MARNNSALRRVRRAEAAATRAEVPAEEPPVDRAWLETEPIKESLPQDLSDRVIRRLCWRARGWAWRASWR